jgi:nitroreductase
MQYNNYITENNEEKTKMNDKEKYAFEAIFSRRSVRSFVEDKPVEKRKIIKLLEAAMAAPSAGNTQPWEFIVVSKKESMDKLKEAYGLNAAMAIITCANTADIPWDNDDWKIDCSAAVENMLIAATAMGLGSVWVGWCQEDILRETFKIPSNIQLLCIVCFGYSDKKPEMGTRYAEDAVFWEKYDQNRIRPPKKVVDYGPVKLNDLSVNSPTPWEN